MTPFGTFPKIQLFWWRHLSLKKGQCANLMPSKNSLNSNTENGDGQLKNTLYNTTATCRGNTTSVSMNETGLPEKPAIYTQCATLADCNACTYEYDDFVSITVNHIFTF